MSTFSELLEGKSSDYQAGLLAGFKLGVQAAQKLLDELPAHAEEAYRRINHTDLPPEHPHMPYSASVHQLPVQPRTSNLLWRNGVHTVGALLRLTEDQIRDFRNCGTTLIVDLDQGLAQFGYALRQPTV